VLGKLARFELFLRRWTERNDLDALAIQCWTSIQANYGACSCLAMSRLGNEGIPSACEADILGTLSMHALQLAGGTPAALADWNNLHNDDELVNVWHCGVFPAVFTSQKPKIGVQEIIAGSGAAAYEDSVGTFEFVADPGALTLTRVTQHPDGSWKAVIVEGALENNPADTFGAYGWCRIADLQHLTATYSSATSRTMSGSRRAMSATCSGRRSATTSAFRSFTQARPRRVPTRPSVPLPARNQRCPTQSSYTS
jgi:L-fucose isomerase-like protein